MNPTAIIADDEQHIATHLKSLLAQIWPELTILSMPTTGKSALAEIQTRQPHIVFLDIRMPELSGLEVAQQLDSQIQIVFVTAYNEYSINAFEQAAVDYLVKPVTQARLANTVNRLKKNLDKDSPISPTLLSALVEQLQHETPEYLQWLRVGSSDLTELIPVDKVVYLKANEKYVSVFTKDKEHLIRKSIKDIETQLDPSQFWRIHRSTLVNVSEIKTAKRDFKGRYSLTLHSRKDNLSVSQTFAHLFRNM